ncbi:MAG: sugar transferase [Actinobacteria bacterium]|nr:sugar transferase [Actinomycetota bacterium]
MKKSSGIDLSKSRSRNLLKRITDIIFSLILILLFLPFWILITIAIIIDSRGSIVFMQERVGRFSINFNMYKFRTMKQGTIDLPAEELVDRESKVTRVGKFLRRFSIDETLQLLNILKGDMSFVGPRPSHLGQKEQIKIRKETGTDSIRPGLTGYAVVNGRDAISIPEKADYDMAYVFNYRPFMDTLIILKTFGVVLTFRGGN